jgi:hypothetical protein
MKTYFVEYEYTEAEKRALQEENIIPLDTKSKAYLIDNLEDVLANNNVLRIAMVNNVIMCPHVTFQTIINTCPSGEHDGFNYSECVYYENDAWSPIPPIYTTTVVSYQPCGGSGGGQPGGGGGSPTPPEEPEGPTNPELADEGSIKTVPVRPKFEPKTPCENAKETTDITKAKNAINEINDLKNKLIQNVKIEHGYSLKDNGNHSFTTGTPTSIEIFTGTEFYSSVHFHPLNGQPMFSFRDLYTLYKTKFDASFENIVKGVSLMIVVNGPSGNSTNIVPTVYSLHITNTNLFSDYITSQLNDPRVAHLNTIDKKLDALNLIHSDIYNSSNPNKTALFLQNMIGKGVKLLQASNDLSTWFDCNLINHGPNASVMLIPCN